MNQHLKWTPAEINILLAHYAHTPEANLLALLPGRTWRAVRREACKHKVRREDWRLKHLRWTEKEIDTLRRVYPMSGISGTLALLPRFSRAAVCQQAHKLGIKAPPRPKKDDSAARKERLKKLLAKKPLPRKAARVVAKPRPAARVAKPKVEKVAKVPVVKSTPKALSPAGKHDHKASTPNANAQRAARLASEQAKKQQPAVTADMIRRLPGAHPARLAWTRAASKGPDAAAEAYYSAMQQAA